MGDTWDASITLLGSVKGNGQATFKMDAEGYGANRTSNAT